MDKDSILQQVKNYAKSGIITKADLIQAYEEATGSTGEPDTSSDAGVKKRLGVAEILYYIGGAIVFLGIAVFMFQNWSSLNTFTKLLTTLGSGIAAYCVGVLFNRYEKLDAVSQAFFLISATVMPIGLYVAFDAAGYRVGDTGIQTTISLILFVTYFASYFLFRKTIFLLFSVIFGTWFFFAITKLMMGDVFLKREKFFQYRTLLTGLSYMFLGYAFSQDEKKPLAGPLYGFGVIFFLGAALFLGGWEPRQNVFWELIFPGLVFGVIFLSIYVKSKAFLTFGTLYLMAYILKITAEYFKDGMGWPLSLVIAGLSMIGIGYGSIQVNKKYLKNRT